MFINGIFFDNNTRRERNLSFFIFSLLSNCKSISPNTKAALVSSPFNSTAARKNWTNSSLLTCSSSRGADI